MSCRRVSGILWLVSTLAAVAHGGDWPMWRCDAGRTATTLQDSLAAPQRVWTRELPRLKPAFRNPRLQFDAGYEPIVVGKLLIVGSSRNCSVTAYDTETGAQRWRFFTEGPVRVAPAAWRDRLFVGSDDGHLYCLSQSGRLIWKFRAVPRARKVLGNARLVSLWPVRGGPVVADDRVYFAAGVWSFEGVFVYALDASSGRLDWVNDRLGYIYGDHPHAAEAFGGLAPQGYLVVDGNDLIVPCSTAYPARLDRKTGALVEFELPKQSRVPGGWFAALDDRTKRDIRRGKLTFDELVNRQQHEDGPRTGAEHSGASRTLRVDDLEIDFDNGYADVEDEIHTMLAADDKIFVVTRGGAIHCFEDGPVAMPTIHTLAPAAESAGQPQPAVERLVKVASTKRGYALVCGLRDGGLLRGLAAATEFQIIGIDPDAARIASLQRLLDRLDLYGSRVTLLTGSPIDLDLPPYLAQVVTTETPDRFGNWLLEPGAREPGAREPGSHRILRTLRPFGGVLLAELDDRRHQAMQRLVQQSGDSSFELVRTGSETLVRRAGALPGTTDYDGGWQASPDELVRAPLGVLWFDDTLGHFKRSPQPTIVDGIMVSYAKDWHAPRPGKDHSTDYPLLPAVLSDVYTGRVLGEDEAGRRRASLARIDPEHREPSQYRPPSQKDAWKPEPPRPGRRINPLTGREEVREFPKSYGCDGGLDYGYIYTMRSGTPAFYDKTIESGTICISGPRSGCTNSIIPANGLLNVPYFYEGCTCSYPLPIGLALAAMPETHEQWSCWGSGQQQEIQRIGINFGAPGDRMTRAGTLWLDFPSVGGPSPELETSSEPAAVDFYYRHSVWIEGGQGWPWVTASGVEGLSSFSLGRMRPGSYTVRLYFAEPGDVEVGQRIQNVSLQGKPVLQDFDIAGLAGTDRGVVKTLEDIRVDKTFRIELTAVRGRTLVSGVELIRAGLPRSEAAFGVD